MPAQYSRERFEAVFPVIADEVLAYMEHEGMPQDARDWMKKVRPLLRRLSPLLQARLSPSSRRALFCPEDCLTDEGEDFPFLLQNLYYNTPGGKLNRGLSVVDTFALLSGKDELSEDEYFKAAVLGWCIELVRCSSLYWRATMGRMS